MTLREDNALIRSVQALRSFQRGRKNKVTDKVLKKLQSSNIFIQQKQKWNDKKEFIICGEKSNKDGKIISPQMRFVKILLSTEQTQNPIPFVSKLSLLIEKVYKDIDKLIFDYFPQEWYKSLKPLKMPFSSSKLIDILDLWEKLTDKKNELNKFEFEILRTFELIRLYFFIGMRYGDWQKFSKEETILRNFLSNQQIFSILEKKKMIILYDPDDCWRCVKVMDCDNYSQDLNSNWRYEIANLEFAQLHTEPPIKIILEERRKDSLSIIAKMLRDKYFNPESLPDRYGVRLAYFSKGDMILGEKFVQQKIWHIDRKAKNVPSLNQHSTSYLNIKAQHAFIEEKQREIQHLPLTQLYSIHHSLGEENHILYHARWYTSPEGLFHQLFPVQLYGLNWNKQQIKRRIYEHIRRQIAERTKTLTKIVSK